MLENVLFICLYVSVLAFSLGLCKAAGVSVFRISVPGIFIVAWLAFAYLGTLPLYFYWDTYRYDIGITDRALLLEVFFYSAVSLVMVSFGFLFTRVTLEPAVNRPVECGTRAMRRDRRLGYSLVAIGITVGVVFFSKLPELPILAAMQEGLSAGKLLRGTATAEIGGVHWYRLFFRDVLEFGVFILLAYALIAKGMAARLVLMVGIGASIFLNLVMTEKAPIAWFLLGMYFTYILARNKGVVPIRGALLMVLFVVVVLAFTYISFMSTEDFVGALASVWKRILTGELGAAYFYVKLIPVQFDYLLGKTLPNPGGLLPFEPVAISRVIHQEVFPEIAALGIRGSMPGPYWTDLYANFGPMGVIFPSFVIGAVLYTVHYTLSRMPYSPVTIALTAYLASHLSRISIASVWQIFLDLGLIVVVIITIGHSVIWSIHQGRRQSSMTNSGQE